MIAATENEQSSIAEWAGAGSAAAPQQVIFEEKSDIKTPLQKRKECSYSGIQ